MPGQELRSHMPRSEAKNNRGRLCVCVCVCVYTSLCIFLGKERNNCFNKIVIVFDIKDS